MIRSILLAAAGAAAALPLAAEPLSLRQAANEALARNPRLVAAGAAVAAAEARRTQARAAWLPLVEASAGATRGNNPVFVFGSLLEQGRFAPQHFDPSFLNDPPSLTNDRLSVAVKYPLFDRLRRFDATRQAGHEVVRARDAAEEVRQQILAEVIERYSALLVAEERRSAAAEAVRAAEAAAKAARDRSEQGLAVDSERLAAEVQLAQFRQEAMAAEGEVAIARAALAMLLRRPLLEPISPASPLPDREFPSIDLHAAIEQALASRGNVAAAQAARASAALQLRTMRGSFLPRLDAVASWGASGQTFARRNSDRTAGVVATIDFDFGRPARVAEARAGVAAAEAMEAAARDAVVMETITAWNREQTARQQLAVAATAVEQAAAAARIAHDRYENGLTTITELLRAQSALLGARTALLAARQQRITAYAELLRSTGGLRDIDPFL